MVLYRCIYCKKDFEKKFFYDRHINIKLNCRLNFDNQIKKYKNFNSFNLILCFFRYSDKDNIFKGFEGRRELGKELERELEVKNENLEKKSVLRCEKCKKIFKSIKGFKKHILSNYCEIEKKSTNMYEKITNKNSNIIRNTTTNITNNTINNTTNNTTNNITINLIPFDSVRYENLPNSIRKNLLETPGLSIQKLLLYEHFNKNKPNQLNILYCNRRDSKMLIYDESELSNNGWSTRNKDEICEIILNKAVYAIEDVVNCNDENNNNLKIKDYKIDAINRLIKDVDNEKKFRKEMKENICDICYDNNNIVKNNKNKIFDKYLTNI
jgi:DNA-directed RNA polymerase subunit RPC12/RpoP